MVRPDRPLVFMMGRSPAFFPADRLYAANHMWAAAVKGGFRFGLTAYAVKLLGDLHCLRWSVRPGEEVPAGATIGYVEGSKAVSDLYAPIAGRVLALNPAPVARPGLLNSDLYDEAWLLESAGKGEELMAPERYLARLEAAWPLAQRLLKGQSAQSEAAGGAPA